MKIQNHEDLQIWQNSIQITTQIYSLTNKNDFSKDFALKDQVRRASISISSNIAEGFERRNNKEFIRFLKISKGSAGEVRSQLKVAHLLRYISDSQHNELNANLLELGSQIGALISYLAANLNKRLTH